MPNLAQRVSELSKEEKREYRESINRAYSRIFDILTRGGIIEEEINNYHMMIRRKVWNSTFTQGKHRYEIIVHDSQGQRVCFDINGRKVPIYREWNYEKFFVKYLDTKAKLKLKLAA